jgi:hypothetical protein
VASRGQQLQPLAPLVVPRERGLDLSPGRSDAEVGLERDFRELGEEPVDVSHFPAHQTFLGQPDQTTGRGFLEGGRPTAPQVARLASAAQIACDLVDQRRVERDGLRPAGLGLQQYHPRGERILSGEGQEPVEPVAETRRPPLRGPHACDQGLPGFSGDPPGDRVEAGLLAIEVRIEAADADPGGVDDVLHGRGLEAAFGEDFGGGGDDPLELALSQFLSARPAIGRPGGFAVPGEALPRAQHRFQSVPRSGARPSGERRSRRAAASGALPAPVGTGGVDRLDHPFEVAQAAFDRRHGRGLLVGGRGVVTSLGWTLPLVGGSIVRVPALTANPTAAWLRPNLALVS